MIPSSRLAGSGSIGEVAQASNGVSDPSRFLALFLAKLDWPYRVKGSLQRQFLEQARTNGKLESATAKSKTLSGISYAHLTSSSRIVVCLSERFIRACDLLYIIHCAGFVPLRSHVGSQRPATRRSLKIHFTDAVASLDAIQATWDNPLLRGVLELGTSACDEHTLRSGIDASKSNNGKDDCRHSAIRRQGVVQQ